jgi:hypothetical protein
VVRSVTTIKVGKRAGRIGCCAIFLGIIRRDAIARRKREEEEGACEKEQEEADVDIGAEKVRDEKEGQTPKRAKERARAYALSGSRDQPVLNVWDVDGVGGRNGLDGEQGSKSPKGKDGGKGREGKGPEHWVARLEGHEKPITCITVFKSCTDASRSM